MKKYLGNIGGAWLGFSLARFADLGISDWEFYAIAVPTITLFVLYKNLDK